MRILAGQHRRSAAGESEGIALEKKGGRALAGYFFHDAALGAARIGLSERQAGAIRGEGSAEILEAAGVVLQLPNDGTIRFGLIGPGYRVPQEHAAEGDGRRAGEAAAIVEGDEAEADSRFRRAGDVGGAGQLKCVRARQIHGVADAGGLRGQAGKQEQKKQPGRSHDEHERARGEPWAKAPSET